MYVQNIFNVKRLKPHYPNKFHCRVPADGGVPGVPGAVGAQHAPAAGEHGGQPRRRAGAGPARPGRRLRLHRRVLRRVSHSLQVHAASAFVLVVLLFFLFFSPFFVVFTFVLFACVVPPFVVFYDLRRVSSSSLSSSCSCHSAFFPFFMCYLLVLPCLFFIPGLVLFYEWSFCSYLYL